jgi:hypothetical protein
MRRHAVLVGINYKTTPTIQLNGCINDVLKMRNLLTDKFHYTNIIVLTEETTASNGLPIRENIIQELSELAYNSENLDEIWFHYSGHGSQIEDNPETANFDDLLVPLDYTKNGYIYDVELLQIIKRIKCRAIFTFDCCDSGTICDLQWQFQYSDKKEPRYICKKIDETVIANPEIYVFSGCMNSESSVDAFVANESVGAFTDIFVLSMRERDDDVGVLDFYVALCEKMHNSGYSQTPVLSCSNKMPGYFRFPLPQPDEKK